MQASVSATIQLKPSEYFDINVYGDRCQCRSVTLQAGDQYWDRKGFHIVPVGGRVFQYRADGTVGIKARIFPHGLTEAHIPPALVKRALDLMWDDVSALHEHLAGKIQDFRG